MGIKFHCPPAEKIARRSLDEKCNVAAAVGLDFSGPALYEVRGGSIPGTAGPYRDVGGDVGTQDSERAEHGEAST